MRRSFLNPGNPKSGEFLRLGIRPRKKRLFDKKLLFAAGVIFTQAFSVWAQDAPRPNLFDTNPLAVASPSPPQPAAPEKPKADLPSSSETSFVSEDSIHFGDVIDVDVIGGLEGDWRGQLDSEGYLSELTFSEKPILGLCRAEDELAAEIVAAYKKVLRNPQAVVRVVDRSGRMQARLLGAIRAPLRLQIERPVRLKEIIVLSGGITERASGEIMIFRPANSSCTAPGAPSGDSQTLTVKLSDLAAGKEDANPFVRAGDIVMVEEAKPIYVTGGVAAPQAVFYRGQKITLTRALASAGGFSRNADAGNITIYRREAGETKIITVDYEKIRKKQTPDIELEARDIVEVQQRGRDKADRPPAIDGWDAAGEIDWSRLPLRVIN